MAHLWSQLRFGNDHNDRPHVRESKVPLSTNRHHVPNGSMSQWAEGVAEFRWRLDRRIGTASFSPLECGGGDHKVKGAIRGRKVECRCLPLIYRSFLFTARDGKQVEQSADRGGAP